MALELRTIELAGSPRQMGRSQGEQLRNEIAGFVRGRFAALGDYCERRGRTLDRERFVAIARACMQQAERFDPQGFAEHLGLAEGAGIEPDVLYAIANLTDVRDLLLLSSAAESEGCSALLIPSELSANKRLIAAQTWDLNPSDLEYIVAVHRRPTDGSAETWSVTLVGCLTLIGMNAFGVALGTTNIKTHGGRVGAGYITLMHRAIREASASAAERVFRDAPRAAAHTYWIADPRGAVELECTPELVIARPLAERPLCRTNHCLAEAAIAIEGEPPTSSSKQRLARLESLLERTPQHDLRSVQAIFADRSDGVDSINRYAEDGQPTATNAVIIALPAERRLIACRGPADRGRFVELGFETA